METENRNPYINIDYFEGLTGDISQASKEGAIPIGERIKSLREQKGMSLEDMSRITGFDADFLLKIEKNDIAPQLGTIIKLSKALDLAFSLLVSGAGTGPYAITRKNDRKAIVRSTSGKGDKRLYAYKGLAPEVEGRSMEPLIVVLEEGSGEETSVHHGEEFIFVLDGIVLLQLGDDRFELAPGDSVYYLSSVPHFISAKDKKATILAVIYEGGKEK
jgi:transcriptional regulator with XRE-family HTH domain